MSILDLSWLILAQHGPQDAFKTPQRPPKTPPRAPKTPPRCLQEPPRRLQEPPARLQEPPRCRQDAFKTPSRPPKTPPRAPKTPPRASKMLPRHAKSLPVSKISQRCLSAVAKHDGRLSNQWPLTKGGLAVARPRRASSIRQTTLVNGRVQNRGEDFSRDGLSSSGF